ncbi:MAG: ParA family protein [Planctomycetes bacterium]|nr:ParA family protein [Planctomycetota bacterium]
MRSIAVANQKGGVGKTTTSVNLAVGLARAGRRVCLVDLDAQAHATLHVGVQPGSHRLSAFDVLTGGVSLADATVVAAENLWLVPSHIDLSATEVALAGQPGRESILARRFADDPACSGSGPAPYDYLIIDCPPSLGLLSLNAMAAVDSVLLPLQPHFLALHGVSKLLETVELVADRVNPRLAVLGVVFCLYESGTRLAQEIGRDVEAFFGAAAERHRAWRDARVFATRIRRNIRLAEAPSFGRSIFDYAPDSHGAEDYGNLAAEIDQAAAVALDAARRAA